MRTIKELIGGDRERLPGTIGKTSLFVKEIIERYGQGGNYVFDPASLVYLFPSVPEEQEEPKKRPEEEKAREYVIRERELQKLEIREKGSREFVQRILESARLPGAREILRRQSARQQAVYWLRELVREYQSAERERIRQIEEEIRTAGRLEREELRHTEVQIERVLRELAGRAGAESIFLPLLKESQIRESFIRLLETVREEDPEVWERISTDITNITDIVGENTVLEKAGQILSYRKEQLRELLAFTERALYLLHTREQAENAREDGKDREDREDKEDREDTRRTAAGVPSAMEAAGEQLQMLEQAWICLRHEDFHLESIQNYHDGIQKLQESIREWQNAESTYREREVRDQIRENLRQLEIRRNLLEKEREEIFRARYIEERQNLEETAEKIERILLETGVLERVRLERAEKFIKEEILRAKYIEERQNLEETVERTERLLVETDFAKMGAAEKAEEKTEEKAEEKAAEKTTGSTENIYKENIHTEQTYSSTEEALKTSLTEGRIRQELEERIKTLIMAEAKLLPLIGRMSGKTWESFREEPEGSRQRDYLLEQMTLEEFWQAESRVLEKYTLDEQERSSLERLERELVYRDIPENLENPKRSALSRAQEWEETVWQPFIREHTIQTERSEQDTLRREVEKIREFTEIEENAREMAGGTLLVTRSIRDLGIVEEKIRRLASARIPEEAAAGEKTSAEEKTVAREQIAAEEIAEKRILRLLHSEERLLHRQEAGGADSDGSAAGAERMEQESGYERLAGLEYHDPASAQEMPAIEGARAGRRQERFRHNTAAAERERQEQKRSEQQQRELKILQDTARRQAEELSRMQEQQKQLEEELSRTREQASPGAQEEMVMRRFQEELRLERLRRGLD